MAERLRVQRVDSLSQARPTGLSVAREEHQHREPEHRVRRGQQRVGNPQAVGRRRWVV